MHSSPLILLHTAYQGGTSRNDQNHLFQFLMIATAGGGVRIAFEYSSGYNLLYPVLTEAAGLQVMVEVIS